MEAEAHEALKPFRGTALVEVEAGPAPLGRLAAYAARFPNSVYLQRARVHDLEYRIQRAGEGRDPDGQGYQEPASTAQDAIRELSSKYMAKLLPLAEELAAIEGSFQPRALWLVGRMQSDNGDEEGMRTLKRIVAKFPGRWDAQEARKDLDRLEAEKIERDEDARAQPPR